MGTIISIIKVNPEGRWYFELVDEEQNRVEYALDVEEYATKIEEMGVLYGGEVEVIWQQEENVSKLQIDEIRYEMMAYEAKMEALKEDQKDDD